MPKYLIFILHLMVIASIDQAVPQEVSMPVEAGHTVDSAAIDSVPGDSMAGDSLPSVGTGNTRTDTLELPQKTAKPSRKDSISREFRKYWAELEKREGIDELRKQMRAATDIDHTWVPRLYFFDSNLVVFPGWFVIRKKEKKRRGRAAIARPRDSGVSQ